MTVFVLLRVENDDEARTLVEDMAAWPGALLTPVQRHMVYATVESTDRVTPEHECDRPWCVDCGERDAAARADDAIATADSLRKGE